MFKEYQSRAVTRKAYCVKKFDKITKARKETATFILRTEGELPVRFKAYEEIKPGDYIVYLTEDDIYHCSAEVFIERNIVE